MRTVSPASSAAAAMIRSGVEGGHAPPPVLVSGSPAAEAAAGVPAVVCGPAGGGMHSADEWVDLAQVRAHADALVDTIGAFCGAVAT